MKRLGMQENRVLFADRIQLGDGSIIGWFPYILVPAITDDPIPWWGDGSSALNPFQAFFQAVGFTGDGVESVGKLIQKEMVVTKSR